MRDQLAFLVLLSLTVSSSALAKDKNTKLKVDNKSIDAPMAEANQKAQAVERPRSMGSVRNSRLPKFDARIAK
jgi:hypothetical protein